MADILNAMRNKGYRPLAACQYGAIGIRRSLSSPEDAGGAIKWFYSGTFMPDKTPITIAARTRAQAKEYVKKGLAPVNEEAR